MVLRRRNIQYLLCLSLVALPAPALRAQIVEEWKDTDMKLFQVFAKLNKDDPSAVEAFFATEKSYLRPDSLGFGWVKKQMAIPGGYISIYADLYYCKGRLLSYSLYCYLPDERKLIRIYKPVMGPLFPKIEDERYSFEYNSRKICMPLKDFSFTKLSLDSSPQVLQYMSPHSGIVYGTRGGIAGDSLENRRAFCRLMHRLTPNQIIQIMYSVNPASRLTAIEYYLKHKAKFTNQPGIDAWIEKVYLGLPKIGTMSGCTGYYEKSRELVEKYVKGD